MDKKEKSPFLVAIGRRVFERRKYLDLTQEQLAEKAEVTPQFISFIESGKQSIRAENIVNLAHALETSTDYLLTGQHNLIDVNRINALLRKFDTKQLFGAEEILQILLTICKYSNEGI